MAWERHENKRGIKPIISIRGISQLGFNAVAIAEFKLENYKYVVLYIDRDLKKIGVKLTNDKNEKDICKLKANKGGAHVSSKEFIAKISKLGSLKSRQIEAQWDDKDKMIVAGLEYN